MKKLNPRLRHVLRFGGWCLAVAIGFGLGAYLTSPQIDVLPCGASVSFVRVGSERFALVKLCRTSPMHGMESASVSVLPGRIVIVPTYSWLSFSGLGGSERESVAVSLSHLNPGLYQIQVQTAHGLEVIGKVQVPAESSTPH